MNNIEPIYAIYKNVGVGTIQECIKETKLIEMYVDWFNNFLTVATFAEYYNISEQSANMIIEVGRNKSFNIN